MCEAKVRDENTWCMDVVYRNYFSSFHVAFEKGQLELQTAGSDAIVETPVETALHEAPMEKQERR
jgi:hypothetical protein